MPNPYDDAAATLVMLAKASDDLDQEISRIGKEIQTEQMKGATQLGSGFALPSSTISSTLQALFDQYNLLRRYREKHLEWGRKIHGVMMGYQREMQTAHRNLVKGRTVGFERADVTVGTNESFAKAVQHKHTVSPENSAVNEMIAKAANQLTGESGEAPLSTQRRIIDVMINDRTNWWPFDLKHFSKLPLEADLWDGVIPFTLFAKVGSEQIETQLTKYKKGKKGLNVTTVGSLSNTTVPTNVLGTGNSSRTYFQVGTGPLTDANVITIKMIYGHPRPFDNGGNAIVIRKAVFVALRDGGVLKVGLQQTTDDKNIVRQHNFLR